MANLLDNINSPDDIKNLNSKELEQLSEEIRQFLINTISKTGGHLASNLGVVELTLALHRTFTSPTDKIVWDVGHQAYVHKIITGRRDKFSTLRQLGGLSGFPKFYESEHDVFDTGHSSTSISAALGMARARDLKKENYSVIAVIGDGALTAGMAFEALNDAGRCVNNFILILNDNEMSISKNVGGMSRYLSKIRTKPFYIKFKQRADKILDKTPLIGKGIKKALSKTKGFIKYLVLPGIIFEEIGFKYLGPIDGHDINNLEQVLSRAKQLKGPVFVHVCTQKGKGYSYAEQSPDIFHGVAPFKIDTGEAIVNNGSSYSKTFGEHLSALAQSDKSIVAITAAMPQGTGLDIFAENFPKRFYDVGIAEQHAVTMAAGLARNGLKPVVAIYSSFLQRAYDQVLHDVALQNLHVVFAIDRAGIVGDDGETHQGIYDISFLSHIPNMTILSPCDYNDFKTMLTYAIKEHNGPIAIRYPRGKGKDSLIPLPPLQYGKSALILKGADVTIAAAGKKVQTALQIADILKDKNISAEVIYARFIKPLDEDIIFSSAQKTGVLITIEDNAVSGGFGVNVLQAANNIGINNIKIKMFGYPDQFISHGTAAEIEKIYGLDAESIAKQIEQIVNK